jgi:alpha-N-arabinofuranosidase
MVNKRLAVLIVVFLAAGRLAGADDAARGPATIVLDVDHPGPVISPLLFGANLEYTRYAMWKGLSAQLLANRSFAARGTAGTSGAGPVETAADEGLAAHWYAVGKRPVALALDTAEPYAGKQSQRIRAPEKGQSGGIGQGDLSIQAAAPYELRAVLKVDSTATVTARLLAGSGRAEYGRRSLQVEKGEWRTWRFQWTSPQTDLHARLEIVFDGPATLWVGAVSLMRGDNFHGMRRDVIRRLKELGVSLLRWPGGAFTRDYRWKEGLQPLDKRPPIHCPFLPFSDQYDFHEVGTDEYLALSRELGCRPCITVTMGIAEGAQEAADWVQYCNGSAGTPWGKLRGQRGHADPYAVEHWCIGNEIWGEWMGPAYSTAEQYARNLRQFAAAMRKADPRLVLIASGTDGVTLGNEWDRTIVTRSGDCFDWISLHHYSPITKALAGPEGAREFTRQACQPREEVLAWLAEMRRAIDGSSPAGKRIPIAFDEWNLWHNWFTRHEESPWHVGPIDAAFAAAQLHMFCQQAGPLDLASAAMFQPVNEGLIRVKPFTAELTAMGQAFALLRAHGGGRLLKTDPPRDARAVDACASLSADGKHVVLSLLNRAADQPREVTVSLEGRRPAGAVATILSVERLEPDALLSRRSEEPAIDERGRINLRLPPFGIALVDLLLPAPRTTAPMPAGSASIVPGKS